MTVDVIWYFLFNEYNSYYVSIFVFCLTDFGPTRSERHLYSVSLVSLENTKDLTTTNTTITIQLRTFRPHQHRQLQHISLICLEVHQRHHHRILG